MFDIFKLIQADKRKRVDTQSLTPAKRKAANAAHKAGLLEIVAEYVDDANKGNKSLFYKVKKPK